MQHFVLNVSETLNKTIKTFLGNVGIYLGYRVIIS